MCQAHNLIFHSILYKKRFGSLICWRCDILESKNSERYNFTMHQNVCLVRSCLDEESLGGCVGIRADFSAPLINLWLQFVFTRLTRFLASLQLSVISELLSSPIQIEVLWKVNLIHTFSATAQCSSGEAKVYELHQISRFVKQPLILGMQACNHLHSD